MMPLEKYQVFESKVILENYDDFLLHTDHAYNITAQRLNSKDTTWKYNRYNIFSITSASDLYYELYKELCGFVREYIGKDSRIWMESWLNYHTYKDLKSLDWHGHKFPFHGYIAIDPKNTVTEFKDFKIENKPGQIYMGLGYKGMEHRVVALEEYDGYRSTLAFNCTISDNTPFADNMLFPVL